MKYHFLVFCSCVAFSICLCWPGGGLSGSECVSVWYLYLFLSLNTKLYDRFVRYLFLIYIYIYIYIYICIYLSLYLPFIYKFYRCYLCPCWFLGKVFHSTNYNITRSTNWYIYTRRYLMKSKYTWIRLGESRLVTLWQRYRCLCFDIINQIFEIFM